MSEIKSNLQEQFMRIQWLFHRYHFYNHKTHGPMGNPYHGQGRILRLLKMNPEISQKDLSYLLDMRPQSLGELLSKLEHKGYITRTPSESDRRVMNIHLTDKGLETEDQVEQPSDYGALFNCLSDEEQGSLSKYLARIIADLEMQFGDDREGFRHKWHGNHRHRLGNGHHDHGGSSFQDR